MSKQLKSSRKMGSLVYNCRCIINMSVLVRPLPAVSEGLIQTALYNMEIC